MPNSEDEGKFAARYAPKMLRKQMENAKVYG